MDENITKLNQIISDCNAIYGEHQKTDREQGFMPLVSLTNGSFLNIYKRTVALIPKFGYAEEDVDKLFTHGSNPKRKLDALYIKNYIVFLEGIREHPLTEENQQAILLVEDKEQLKAGVVDLLDKMFKNFHRCYRQLLIRHSQRDTLQITDEYDVQDLLHAILKLHFDDVRAEFSIPRYAGGNSRIDFIINEHNIAIEVKKTRSNLKDKEIGEELLIDIARYQQSYSKIKLLICFVYDPDGLIINPIGLENDLNNTPSNIPIKTIICPKH